MWVTKKIKKKLKKKKKKKGENNTGSFPLSRAICYSSRKLSSRQRHGKKIATTWYFFNLPSCCDFFFSFFFFPCRWREYMTTQGIWKCENTTARQYENVGTWNGGNEKLVESRDTCFRPECINVRMVWTNKTNSKWMEQCGKNNTKIFGHLFM